MTICKYTVLISLFALSIAGCSTLKPCDLSNADASPNSCVFAPREGTLPKSIEGKINAGATAYEESDFRKWVGEPDWSDRKTSGPTYIAVALSGGGSKAAPVAMGVLAGLDDLNLLGGVADKPTSPRVGLISSVSGGGYAAYYFFAQAVTDRLRGVPVWPNKTRYADLFSDAMIGTENDFECDDTGKKNEEKSVFTSALCQHLKEKNVLLQGKWGRKRNLDETTDMLAKAHPRQFVVRCAQDVFLPGKCDMTPTSQDHEVWGSHFGLLLANVLVGAPFHHVANTIFDSGVNLSPSRYIYEYGIGTTYGATPLEGYDGKRRRDGELPWRWPRVQCQEQLDTEDIDTAPADARRLLDPRFNGAKLINCRTGEGDEIRPRPLAFSDLTESWKVSRRDKKNDLPFWVIQASGVKYRSLIGWAKTLDRDAWLDSFEFTPLSYGSRRYGFVPGHPESMSVLKATTTAAAFFDANQQVVRSNGKGLIAGALQHAFDLNWGWDLPNYNVSDGRRNLHRFLPLPVTWLDSVVANAGKDEAETDRRRSAFIRLVDGGSSENLSAISALRRGFKTIVIADAAQDNKGDFGDLCFLAEQIEYAPLNTGQDGKAISMPGYEKFSMHVPALEHFREHCAAKKDGGHYDLRKAGVPMAKGEIPALLGCISPSTSAQPKEACSHPDAIRLVIIKPMLNLERWDKDTQWNEQRKVSQCTQGHFLFRVSDPSPIDCSKLEAGAECVQAVPCEVARLMGNYTRESYRRQFPQTTTVATTANSSASLFSAYRELARQQLLGAHRALDIADKAESQNEARIEFASMAEEQTNMIKLCLEPLAELE